MAKNIKINKREMKEDKFTTFMLQSKDMVTQHWMYFVGALVLIFAIVLAVGYFKDSQAKAEVAAGELYSKATSSYLQGNFNGAVVDYQAVVENYGSSSYGKQALFELANSYYGAKRYDQAKATYEQYVAKYKDDKFFNASAIAGIAASLVGLGDFAAAADKYRDAADAYPEFELAGDYLVKSLYFYLKADNTESAKVVLARIKNDYKGSTTDHEAQLIASEHNLVI